MLEGGLLVCVCELPLLCWRKVSWCVVCELPLLCWTKEGLLVCEFVSYLCCVGGRSLGVCL